MAEVYEVSSTGILLSIECESYDIFVEGSHPSDVSAWSCKSAKPNRSVHSLVHTLPVAQRGNPPPRRLLSTRKHHGLKHPTTFPHPSNPIWQAPSAHTTQSGTNHHHALNHRSLYCFLNSVSSTLPT